MLASSALSSSSESQARTIAVLARPASSKLNPYTNLLYQEVRKAGARVESYSPARALLGRYDIFHIHWPESVFNHGLLSAKLTTGALLLAMRRQKQRGTKLVWTVHNLRAHDRRYPRQEAEFWRAFIPKLDGYFLLTPAGKRAALERFPELAQKAGFVVPHPHYRGCYPDSVTREQARTTLNLPGAARVLLFVGTIANYKNVPELIHAFHSLPGDNLRLVIAGQPRTALLWQQLKAAAQSDTRILLHAGHVKDVDLQTYLRAANLVVLPFQEILNSGSAVLGLTFDRPVLMPRLGAAEDLERLMGNAWVKLYEGRLGPEQLALALKQAESLPERTLGQHLGPLSPEGVGQATVEAYRKLLTL